MKKTVKILTIILLAVMLVSFATSSVFAAGGEIKPNALNATYGTDDGGLAAKAGSIMGMIRNIAVVASVIILMILGVKFMLGSSCNNYSIIHIQYGWIINFKSR